MFGDRPEDYEPRGCRIRRVLARRNDRPDPQIDSRRSRLGTARAVPVATNPACSRSRSRSADRIAAANRRAAAPMGRSIDCRPNPACLRLAMQPSLLLDSRATPSAFCDGRISRRINFSSNWRRTVVIFPGQAAVCRGKNLPGPTSTNAIRQRKLSRFLSRGDHTKWAEKSLTVHLSGGVCRKYVRERNEASDVRTTGN